VASSREIRRENRKGPSGSAGGNKTILVALVVFTALALAAIAAFALASSSGSSGSSDSSGSFTPNDQGLLQPGAEAPDFSAESVDGGEISLPEGEPTLLTFFATWCPHCNDEAPVLAELAQENGNLNVIMAGMDGEDDPEKVRQFVEEYGIEGEALYQPSLGQAYQVTGYPTTYVIDGQGQIVGANSGETPKDVLQGWIDEASS